MTTISFGLPFTVGPRRNRSARFRIARCVGLLALSLAVSTPLDRLLPNAEKYHQFLTFALALAIMAVFLRSGELLHAWATKQAVSVNAVGYVAALTFGSGFLFSNLRAVEHLGATPHGYGMDLTMAGLSLFGAAMVFHCVKGLASLIKDY